ncbi:N-acetylmuramoyl-L-alanine amidase family protein [Clostridium beijerinckii]|uniref:N-acetylmuramoyl-L-alanine amidase family protein n=1 Tax=Clostridium beijerinckii TaxID=1520 RepID=UPI00156D7539|nr:N-acetylmuramoyl-L-alanine amidase family protein [Clostridium beijerinckii]NRY02333.1 glucan-binding YG repeat protein [Clostridium beijerinckii]
MRMVKWLQAGEIDGDTYYFNKPGGSMGWSKEVDGKYLGPDGRQVKDERWVNTKEDKSGTWYYVGAHERNVTGWNKIGNDFYYFNYPGGSMTYNNTINGFDIDNDGKIVSGTGWLQDEYSGEWYYFSDGERKTDYWVQDGDSWYYLNDDGSMATGWKYINGDWYYFHSDGEMATGWVEDDTGWYFLYNNGSMAHDLTVGGYHVDKSGKMITGTGWVPSDGSWYFLKDDGEVATNWQRIDDVWYYLYPQGSMAHDTTIDGYYLKDSGEWAPNTNTDDDSSDSQSDSGDTGGWNGNTTLKDLLAEAGGAWKDSNATGFELVKQYYLAWYYGTNAEERSNVNMSASSYVVYDLSARELSGEDISALTVNDIDHMCNNIGTTQNVAEIGIFANVDEEGYINKKYSGGGNKAVSEAENILRKGYDPILADKAIAARDAKVAEIQAKSKSQQQKYITVVGGYNIETGEVAVGVKNTATDYKKCAENLVVEQLGGDPSKVIMTPAIRPRNNATIPVCKYCQEKYSTSNFIPGTTFGGD